MKELKNHGVLLTLEQRTKETARSESKGSPLVCEAIGKATAVMKLFGVCPRETIQSATEAPRRAPVSSKM